MRAATITITGGTAQGQGIRLQPTGLLLDLMIMDPGTAILMTSWASVLPFFWLWRDADARSASDPHPIDVHLIDVQSVQAPSRQQASF
jgi:hypothetical protein